MKSKMKKTIASLLTAAIATMSFGSMMTANAASYNKTFRIYYSLKTNNSGVSKMTSQLKYNYNIVEVKKVIKGNLGGSHGFSQDTYGVMDVSYNNTSNINTQGTLMYVSFDAPTSVSNLSDYVQSYKVTSVKNTAGASLPISKVSTDIVLVGDIDQDGEVKSNDLLKLKEHLSSNTLSGNALKAADANGDLNVDEDDYELLRKYILNLEDFDK